MVLPRPFSGRVAHALFFFLLGYNKCFFPVQPGVPVPLPAAPSAPSRLLLLLFMRAVASLASFLLLLSPLPPAPQAELAARINASMSGKDEYNRRKGEVSATLDDLQRQAEKLENERKEFLEKIQLTQAKGREMVRPETTALGIFSVVSHPLTQAQFRPDFHSHFEEIARLQLFDEFWAGEPKATRSLPLYCRE
eukprot:GHVT01066072.1.p1 GENE.GHVT01066072.1~~GHVT01066072.1.p1  ORF type:complete len:194 (+),score=40.39 GHVT01066072.1:1367-1948(+)